MPDYTIKLKITAAQEKEWVDALVREVLDITSHDVATGLPAIDDLENFKGIKRLIQEMRREAKVLIKKLIAETIKNIQGELQNNLFDERIYDQLYDSVFDDSMGGKVYKQFRQNVELLPAYQEWMDSKDSRERENMKRQINALAQKLGMDVELKPRKKKK